jgi:hypothetical protein
MNGLLECYSLVSRLVCRVNGVSKEERVTGNRALEQLVNGGACRGGIAVVLVLLLWEIERRLPSARQFKYLRARQRIRIRSSICPDYNTQRAIVLS